MGAVYEAEQDQPRRSVALKVIKAAWASPEMLRRFEQESQALGRLQHPGIAQIYEAGSADTGFGVQPFFAMELIHGKPLVEYADEHKLNTRQRLELMIQVCDAVHHAHQRGIIHRDLKPCNILVDETGQPKILDFGLARATDSDAQTTRQTDMGQLLGTLAYMSPEQVLADPYALDTRSDVYALGVILYELLAGKMPYALSRHLHEAVRTIQLTDPAPLSTVSRVYRGDIETIVAKALEKDKERRYASAAGLAGDIRRYLNDEPIIARPAGMSYQLQKFARRNKALVAGVAAVFVVLVLGIVASTWEAVQARKAEKRAQQESAIAQSVNDFLQNDILGQASAYNQSGPGTKPDPDLKVRTALDRAAERITGKFGKQPEVEAAIRDTMGQTYQDLGLYPEARKQLERALDLERRVFGAENPKTLRTMSRLGALADRQGNNTEAETLLSQAFQVSRRVLGPEHPDTLRSMSRLAGVYYSQGKYVQAEALYSKTLEIERRVLGPEHPNTLACMNNLANVYFSQSKYAQAESLYGQTLEIERRVLGPEHPNTLESMNNLALTSKLLGNYARAEALLSQALEIERRVLGPEHPDTLASMGYLANVYFSQSKYVQAEALFSQTVETKRHVLGPEHPSTLESMGGLARVYCLRGEYAQAETLSNQILEIQRRVLGPEHSSTLSTLSDVASMYQRQGKYFLAETYAAQVLVGRRHALGSEDQETMSSAADLALAYLSQGKFAESVPLAHEAVETDRRIQPEGWERFRAESLLGASLAGQKKYVEAEPLLLEGYQGMLARKIHIDVPDLYQLKLAHQWLVQLYEAWGKPDKAAEWNRK
jgi:tetratricopeptide (TPR) repeat protein/predicted Ser/Thr protein kinase